MKTMKIYFLTTNGGNYVVLTDAVRWIAFDNNFENIDLYSADVLKNLSVYINKNAENFNKFDDMFVDFSSRETDLILGFDFSADIVACCDDDTEMSLTFIAEIAE